MLQRKRILNQIDFICKSKPPFIIKGIRKKRKPINEINDMKNFIIYVNFSCNAFVIIDNLFLFAFDLKTL